MSQLEDDMMSLENPEGYPRCPKCGDYVVVTEVAGDTYFCGGCNYTFPLELAVV